MWVTVYKGMVEQATGGEVVLKLMTRYGLRYHPGYEGWNKNDWYCVPRRRYCISPIGFSDWGGQHLEGETKTFDQSMSFSASQAPINGVKPIIAKRCP